MIKPGEIQVKNKEVLRSLLEKDYHPLLITISCEIAQEFGIFITEAWRKPKHPGDIHSTKPGRALDLRVRVYGSLEQAENIKDWINQKWQYDFERPEMKVAIIHDVGGGKHFHVQVSQATRRTGKL